MGIQKVALAVINQELNEQTHVERVEDVIYWALQHYAKRGEGTLGELVASSIVERIDEEERKYQENNN